MRFALVFLILYFGNSLAVAAPGDKYTDETKWSERPAIKRQIRSNDRPMAPVGFSVTKIGTNLGDVVGLAVINNDLFVADAAQDRVLRLKSRNANHLFETRAEFLIGFTQISDLAVSSNWLFMSDKTGVWKIDVGNSLVATQAPKLLYSNPATDKNFSASIDVHTKKDTLVVGLGGCVFAVDIATGKASKLTCGKWQIQDIAVSPIGGIWASVLEQDTSYIVPIRAEKNSPPRLKLPPNSNAPHIQFWPAQVYPKNWPLEWTSDLIFSLTGNQPMLARAHFNFGDIATEFTSFIDGFSNSSRFVGGREYWGLPTAMTILGNGQLIFAEGNQGTLWAIQKNKVSTKRTEPKPPKQELVIEEAKPKKKFTPPVLPQGSSIGAASALETDQLLRKPEIVDQNQELEED